MRVNLWRIGVETCNKLPLLDGFQAFLAFDNDYYVFPDRVFQRLDISVYGKS